MNMLVLCDNALCSLVDIDRRFKGAYCIALMMEAVRFFSETSVIVYQTTQLNIPEDSDLNTIFLFVLSVTKNIMKTRSSSLNVATFRNTKSFILYVLRQVHKSRMTGDNEYEILNMK
jgi:hypothetical protein